MTTTAKFETGRIYHQRSIVDSDFIYRFEVLKRTAKTVLLRNVRTGDEKRCRISEWGGVEQVKPNGTYSMCLVLGADRVEA